MHYNFTAVMREVFAHEGGYANHRADPGGETNYGISKRSYPHVDIRNLTKAKAEEIYRKDFWEKVRGDDLPEGIDLVAMDAAVNSGVSRGSTWLQRALDVNADGAVGPVTVAAAKEADAVAVIEKACAYRLGFLQSLSTWKTFGRGWGKRVASVEAEATRMAMEGAGKNSNAIIAVLSKKAADALADAKSKAGAAAGAAVAGAASTGVSVTDVLDVASDAGLAGGLLSFVVALVQWIRRGRQMDRAEAFKSVRNAVIEGGIDLVIRRAF